MEMGQEITFLGPVLTLISGADMDGPRRFSWQVARGGGGYERVPGTRLVLVLGRLLRSD